MSDSVRQLLAQLRMFVGVKFMALYKIFSMSGNSSILWLYKLSTFIVL